MIITQNFKAEISVLVSEVILEGKSLTAGILKLLFMPRSVPWDIISKSTISWGHRTNHLCTGQRLLAFTVSQN